MKKLFSTVIVGMLFLSLLVYAIPVATSTYQLGKLQDKPEWAGNPGDPKGGGGGDSGGEDIIAKYELYIEVDYIQGHAPTPEVLDYIISYYRTREIRVIFYVDGYPNDISISQEIPSTGFGWDADDGISDAEFNVIEAEYNDNDGGYYSKWKWVLFGTTVEGDSLTMGYTWVTYSLKYFRPTGAILDVDFVAGNYIYIADHSIDVWAPSSNLEIGAEAVVLMHEIGHSIGIGVVGWSGNLYTLVSIWEIYDPDPYSVMSYLSVSNAGLSGEWYYSDAYWATRNMKYYR